MPTSRSVSFDRIAAIVVVCCATFWLASAVFFDVVSRDSRLAPFGYGLVALTAAIAAVLMSSTRRRDILAARRVPRIPGGNSRFAYRPVSRQRGTILMGSTPTLL